MKKLQSSFAIAGILAVFAITAACAASPSADSYARASTRTSFDVRYGEVLSVRAVEIEGDSSILGRLGGAWIGYALGRGDTAMFVGSRGLEAAVGGVAGTIAGEAIERKITSEEGLELIVRLHSNETIAVVQATDIVFSPGDQVQVLFGRDGSTRVQPL